MSTNQSDQEREPVEPLEPDEPGTMPEEDEGVTPPEPGVLPEEPDVTVPESDPEGTPDAGTEQIGQHAAVRASLAAPSSCVVHQ
jgi:hypothetical protein